MVNANKCSRLVALLNKTISFLLMGDVIADSTESLRNNVSKRCCYTNCTAIPFLYALFYVNYLCVHCSTNCALLLRWIDSYLIFWLIDAYKMLDLSGALSSALSLKTRGTTNCSLNLFILFLNIRCWFIYRPVGTWTSYSKQSYCKFGLNLNQI